MKNKIVLITAGKYFEKSKETATGKNANSEGDVNTLWSVSMKLAGIT